MRDESRVSSSGRCWFVSAGCVGLLIASAFIGLTLRLGGPLPRDRQKSTILASGPDPTSELQDAGPTLVRRKGSPLWGSPRSSQDQLDLDHDESATATVITLEATEGLPTTTVEPPKNKPTVAGRSPIPPRTPIPRRTVHTTLRPINLHWNQILHSFNRSRLGPRLMERLKDLSQADPAQLIRNTSSLVSFGLLAVDLFLLHNVQRIAFTEQAGKQLSADPEVQALNSLFEGIGQRKDRRAGRGNRSGGGLMGEVVGYLQNAVRGVTNLGRAYRRAQRARSVGPTPLDCIWTLYCRNLEKTAKIGGPYGFLAKMNSLGLRLVLGELAPEEAIDKLMYDVSNNGTKLNCDTLFPRCGAEEAKRVVLATANGERNQV